MSDKKENELVSYRLKRARQTINEIEEHLQNGFYHTAVNRIYYASFYAVSALLLANGLNTRTHAGARQLFGKHFILSGKINRDLGKFYSEIFDYRHTSDYDDFIEIDKQIILELYNQAKELILQIELILQSEQK